MWKVIFREWNWYEGKDKRVLVSSCFVYALVTLVKLSDEWTQKGS
jgi:hypothetical protein